MGDRRAGEGRDSYVPLAQRYSPRFPRRHFKDPILVTRRGRLAGVFFPCPQQTLPLELKREMFGMLSATIARQLKRKRLAEDDILVDFENWRRKRRETRR